MTADECRAKAHELLGLEAGERCDWHAFIARERCDRLTDLLVAYESDLATRNCELGEVRAERDEALSDMRAWRAKWDDTRAVLCGERDALRRDLAAANERTRAAEAARDVAAGLLDQCHAQTAVLVAAARAAAFREAWEFATRPEAETINDEWAIESLHTWLGERCDKGAAPTASVPVVAARLTPCRVPDCKEPATFMWHCAAHTPAATPPKETR